MLWVAGALLLAFGIWLVDALWLTPLPFLTPEDLVVTPGKPLILEMKVERRVILFVDPPIANAEVTVHLDDRRIGVAVTGADGRVKIDAGPAGPVGLYRYVVRCGTAEEALIVRVIEPDSPLLVVDLDSTLAWIHSWRYPMADDAAIHPMPGAAEVLPRLAARHALVYLTARDPSFLARTRAWLRRNGFPEGPLFIRHVRYWEKSAYRHKTDRLKELALEHKLGIGVGDTAGDMKAYLDHGMRAYLMRPTGRVENRDGVTRVRSWIELENLISRPS